VLGSGCDAKIAVSSADVGISAVYMRQRIGRSTLPCGTPDRTKLLKIVIVLGEQKLRVSENSRVPAKTASCVAAAYCSQEDPRPLWAAHRLSYLFFFFVTFCP
jgi:hypothetical protein